MGKKLILIVPIAVLALAGCGGSSSSSSSSSNASSSASANTPAATSSTPAAAPTSSFLAPLRKVSTVGSTVPAAGDVNPYGIVLVTQSIGKLHAGSVLVSNFNDKANNQGTGTTIAQLTLAGNRSLFANVSASRLPGKCPGGVGLTTALSLLPGGYVVVGSLPTTNGKSATARFGCLLVLDSRGKPVSTISGPQIAGPWDMTAATKGSITNLFVSNALNGGAAKGVHTIKNSTVLRIRMRSGRVSLPRSLISR